MVNESTVVIPLAEENNIIIKKIKKEGSYSKEGVLCNRPESDGQDNAHPIFRESPEKPRRKQEKQAHAANDTVTARGPHLPSPLSLLHSTRLDSTTHLSTNSQLHQANQNPKSPTPNSEFPPKSLAARRFSPAETRFSKEFWFPEAEQAENRLVFLLGWGRG